MVGHYARHDGIELSLYQENIMIIKDQIKKLELQVDRIIGYCPSGHPWKHEYILRRSLIERMLQDTSKTETLQAIQKKLIQLYKQLPYRQGYIFYTQQEYWKPIEKHPPIKAFYWDGDKNIETIL